ncbi:MAG: MGMT family protein [Candidatus Diapherotrites archaeon]|nr:MGMT family protein [Candidatus Diapherotrites archaeon]
MPKAFDEAVWRLLRKIPRGRVTTYKRIAAALGKPGGARAVGNACGKNPRAPQVPCHRVVKSDGSIGGYAKGAGKKISLLRSERVGIRGNRVLELKKIIFRF